MYISKIFAAVAVVITLLFNWFPNSEFIAELYYSVQSSEFGWAEVTDTIEEAIEEKDAKTLSLMGSQKLKEKCPNLEQDIQKFFGSIKGDILSVEYKSEFSGGSYQDYRFFVTTTTDDYQIFIFYTAVGPDESVYGLRRMMVWVKTDEYHSWWTDTENYITEGVIEETERISTRSWKCGNGNSADKYVFMVNEKVSKIKGQTNVSVIASRNDSGRGVPESGFAFDEDDMLKVHLIPEGEEPPALGTRKPDIIITADDRILSCYADPGRYYLYVEPSDMEMYYSISVKTRL